MIRHNRHSFQLFHAADTVASGGSAASEPAPPATPPTEPDKPAEPTPPAAPSAQETKPGIFARASALLATREGIAATLAAKDKEIVDAKALISGGNEKIKALTATNEKLTAELTALRGESEKLETAMNKLEGEKKTVSETVASLGFDPAKLPATVPGEQASGSREDLLAAFKSETDPVKKAAIYEKINKLANGKN